MKRIIDSMSPSDWIKIAGITAALGGFVYLADYRLGNIESELKGQGEEVSLLHDEIIRMETQPERIAKLEVQVNNVHKSMNQTAEALVNHISILKEVDQRTVKLEAIIPELPTRHEIILWRSRLKAENPDLKLPQN